VNPQEEEYVTLFCEGDGSTYLVNDWYPCISFAQKERNVLDYIESLNEGGHFYQNPDGTWKLTYSGDKCISLLEILSRHAVSKRFLDRLNHVLDILEMPLAEQHPTTLDGFVGFWDAEGSSVIDCGLQLGQKDREILDIIQRTFGGHVYSARTWFMWDLHGDEARKLAPILIEKSHCPSKVERLKYHFGEQGREKNKAYHLEQYYKHREEILARDRKRREQQKLTREYIKQHLETSKNEP